MTSACVRFTAEKKNASAILPRDERRGQAETIAGICGWRAAAPGHRRDGRPVTADGAGPARAVARLPGSERRGPGTGYMVGLSQIRGGGG